MASQSARESQPAQTAEISVLCVQLASPQNSPERGNSGFHFSLHCQSPCFLVHTTKSQLKPEVNLLHDITNAIALICPVCSYLTVCN